jgi:hypothetical protein
VVGAITDYGGIASLVLGLILAALLLTRGGGSTSTPQPEVRPASGPRTGEIPRRQPGQFGGRP